VNASAGVRAKALERGTVEKEFPRPPVGWSSLGKMLRVHQWLKNLLLFVPLLAAHDLANLSAWGNLALAFVAFCLCASSVYIANDLLDLESDRLHPRKRLRPFASGTVPIGVGVLVAPVLLCLSLWLGGLVNSSFFLWLLGYFLLTCLYSWLLKRLMLIDSLTLAFLYTLRIIAGAAAAGQVVSFWLLAFSVFLFLSLAFVKRYAELELQRLNGKMKLHGRGYHTDDGSLVQTMGITSGYAAVLVLAMYLNSDAVVQLYRSPEVIWGTVPVVLFWISWMWMQAHRGLMNDDPLVFAVKDRASLAAGLVFALILYAGTRNSLW
jgi:4-hydroxybenzoate polyprenyltransferase